MTNEKDFRPKRLNLRVDSSTKIGSGHVSRMIPLALEAFNRGMSARIIAQELSVESQSLLLSKGIPWVFLPPSSAASFRPSCPTQTPTSSNMLEDAIHTAQVADAKFHELLVTDHYGIDDSWFFAVEKFYEVCSAVVDGHVTNLSIEKIFELEVWPLRVEDHFSKLESAASLAKNYWGNPFFLFSPEIQGIGPSRGPNCTQERVFEILLFLGFSDVEELTHKLLLALASAHDQFDLKITLVTSSDLAKKFKSLPNLNLKVFEGIQPSSFFQMCLQADFVLGSPGVSSVERTKLGIPQLLFSVADNQLGLGERLNELSVAVYGGDLRTLGPAEIEVRILNFIRESLTTFDTRFGQQMFDYLGPARLLQVLAPNDQLNCSVREANLSDGPTLFLWANDPVRRLNSRESGLVLPKEHLQWMKETLGKGSMSSIYIFLNNQQPVGQIQFHPTEVLEEYEIGYSLDTVFRGQGLARRAIEMGIISHSRSTRVARYSATVKASNHSSLRALWSVGFEEESVLVDGFMRLVLDSPKGGVFEFV